MAKNVFTVKACKAEDFDDWKTGKTVFLVKDQLFASVALTQERLDYTQERMSDEDIDWNSLSQDEKKELYNFCLAKDGRIPVTYKEYEEHTHMDPICVDDIVLFNTMDGSLDVNDDMYISGGGHTINMSRIMKLIDPAHKYTREEMVDIYNAFYPFIKRDEEGKIQA